MPIGTIVVGSSTLALLNCLFSDSSLIVNSPRRPPIYSTMGEELELELWTEIYWILFLRNKILTHGVKNINLFEDKIEVIHENNIKDTWNFEHLYLGGYEQINGYGVDIFPEKGLLEVRDYFAVKSGMAHNKKLLETPDPFVKKVVFYISSRIDGNKSKKDAVTISYIKEGDLRSFDYSDTIARFKLEKLMNANLNLNRKAKTQHFKREIISPQDFKIINAGSKIKKLPLSNLEELYARYKSEYTK